MALTERTASTARMAKMVAMALTVKIYRLTIFVLVLLILLLKLLLMFLFLAMWLAVISTAVAICSFGILMAAIPTWARLWAAKAKIAIWNWLGRKSPYSSPR